MNLSDASVLAVLADLSDEIHCILDSRGFVEDANPAFHEALGLAFPFSATVALKDLAVEEDRRPLEEFIRASHERNQQRSIFRFETKKSTRFIELKVVHHKGSSRYLLCGRDITETQTRLGFLKQIESSSNVGAWEIDLKKNTVYWSDQVYRIHDCDPQSFRPTVEEAIKFYHPDSLTTLQIAVDLLMRNGRSYDLKLKLITAMGRTIWVRSIAHAEMKDGKAVRCYGSFQDITAEYEQEELLRMEVERLNAISNNIPIMMAIFDSENNIEWMNRAWRRDLGWGADPANENELLRDEVLRSLQQLQSGWTELQLSRINGDRIDTLWYRVKLSADRCLFIGKDRSEERRLHDMLLEQNEQLELAMKVGGLATIKISPTDGIVQLNPEWSKMLDLPFNSGFEPLIYWEEAFHPDDFPLAWGEIEECLSGAQSEFQDVYRLKKRTGEYIDVFHRGQITERNSQGLPTKLLILALDVSKQTALQTELARASAEAKMLFDSALDPLCVLDLEGRFIRVNPAFEKTLGFQNQQLIGKEFSSLAHPDDQRAQGSLWDKFRDNFSVQQLELRYRDAQGKYRDFSCSASSDKETQRIFCSIRDITEQKAAAVIMHQSSKLAALGEMAGGIAHEINNPLTIIQGKSRLIQMALKQPSPNLKKIHEDFDRICFTTDRIAKIIRGLRTISRDSSKDPFEPTELGPLIEDTMGLCHEKFRFKEILLSYDCPPDLIVSCRPAQISQVLLNLVQNAGDAVETCENRWVRVIVEERGDFLQIAVIDSGPGVPTEIRSRIMEPFFTTKDTSRGTGLGLSISRAIAVDHGGRLYLDEYSNHTKFVFEVPKRQSAVRAA